MIAPQAVIGGKACVQGRSTSIASGSIIAAPAVSWPVVTLSGEMPCCTLPGKGPSCDSRFSTCCSASS